MKVIIASENTVLIYDLNKCALSTKNKDKERRGKKKQCLILPLKGNIREIKQI